MEKRLPLAKWEVEKDESVDIGQLEAHFKEHHGRWNAVEEFLKRFDPLTAVKGNYEIQGKEVFAFVTEYDPIPAEKCQFEAHRKYIDLQYVFSGKEMMGVTKLSGLKIATRYVDDIEFYEPDSKDAKYSIAASDKYFIFFPNQAHMPGMECEGSTFARKLVIKIKY